MSHRLPTRVATSDAQSNRASRRSGALPSIRGTARTTNVGSTEASGVGGPVVELFLRFALCGNPRFIVGDFALAGLGAPPERFRHQVSDGSRRSNSAIRRLDRDPRAPCQQIVQMQRAFVGRCVERLDAQIGLRSLEGLSQLGPIGDQGQEIDTSRAVALEQTSDSRFA